MPATPRARLPAFSLVEAVVAMGIVSIVVVGAMSAIGTVAARQRDLIEQTRAVALAQALLGEIIAQPYEDSVLPTFGPEIGEVRALFDDVDDYADLVESPPTPGLSLLDSAWNGWKRTTRIKYVQLADPSATAAADSGLKSISVSVRAPSGRTVTLVGLRARAGLYDKTAESTGAYTARVGVSIEIAGDGDSTIQQSAALTNTVP
ncbi:MAG: type II secretion system protein [Phycisphaerales bacterium]|nr:type II secretion system protein [Phycisphaerales bacterium]